MSTRKLKLSLLAVTGFVVLLLGARVALSAPPWGIACGDGRVDTILDNFDSPWVFGKACPSIPNPALHMVPGCNGNAMAVDYALTDVCPLDGENAGQSWIVLQRFFSSPMDLTTQCSGKPCTHIRLAWHGSNLNSHDSIEVKLHDGEALFATSLKSMTDMPVWRVIYIDLREFTNGDKAINLKNIVRLEIAIVRCDDNPVRGCEVFDNPSVGGPPEEYVGTVFLDEFAAVDLKSGAVNRLIESDFEKVVPNPTVQQAAASALFNQVTTSGPPTGLLPAWFPELNPNYNMYVQAEALLVFLYEYERTHDMAYRTKASDLADKLIALQIAPPRINAGAWYTAHDQTLQPPSRALPPVQPCNGDETIVPDIDACEWVGNVGWLLIALGKLQRSGFYAHPTALQDALDRGAAWVVGQFNRNVGIEGSISAYFGLLAAGKQNEAALLGQAIFQSAWDPIQRHLKSGGGPADAATPIDATGSWGVTFLRSLGRIQEALDSQAYAASVMRVCSFDNAVCGYGDIAGPYTPAVEFTAQAAAAGIKDADVVMQEVAALQIRCNDNYGKSYPGAFPSAADHWYGGPLTPWNTTMCGVSPTAWMYFSLNGDPLLELLVPTLSLSVNQPSMQRGNTLTLTALVTPGPTPVTADVYIALQPPGCTSSACIFFWQGGLSFTATPQPILRNWLISPFHGPIFTYTFGGTEPAGRYVWLGAFVVPGTGTLIGGITEAPFTFSP